MNNIFKRRITAISGWGVGLVILLILFRGRFDISGQVARVADGLLAILVAIFFMMFAIAVSVGVVAARTLDEGANPVGGATRILSLGISGLMIVIGWLVMKCSENEYVVPLAVATLGALVSGAGCVISYFSIMYIFRRNET